MEICMKKIGSLVIILLVLVSLISCGGKKQNEVYSFSGSCDDFSITGGSVVISDKECVFDSGKLSANKSTLDEVKYYKAVFYTRKDTEVKEICVDEFENKSPAQLVEMELVTTSGTGSAFRQKLCDITDDFWCELEVEFASSEKKTYIIELDLIKDSK